MADGYVDKTLAALYKALAGPTNPEVPAPPLGQQTTNFGPTIDSALNDLPGELRQMYRQTPLRLGVDQPGGAIVRAENFKSGPIRLSYDILSDRPEFLYQTLAHEGIHELQERRPDLVDAPDRGFFEMFNPGSRDAQEREAYDRASVLFDDYIRKNVRQYRVEDLQPGRVRR